MVAQVSTDKHHTPPTATPNNLPVPQPASPQPSHPLFWDVYNAPLLSYFLVLYTAILIAVASFCAGPRCGPKERGC